MSSSPDDIKNSYDGKRCFNKKTAKIGYLDTPRVRQNRGHLFYFNVETGKLNSEGKKETVEELWNIGDITIMEKK